MVVDDDPAQRNLVRDFLSPLGFKVLSIGDGRTCLEAVAVEQPDVFLLDISMPGMTGCDLARRLRQWGHEAAVIIMISANADERGRDPVHRVFHDDYLSKPFRLTDLLKRLQSQLRIEWRTGEREEELVQAAPTSPRAATSGPSAPKRSAPRAGPFVSAAHPSEASLEMLRQLTRMGHVRAIREKFDEIAAREPQAADFVDQMRVLVKEFDIKRYEQLLETVDGDDGHA